MASLRLKLLSCEVFYREMCAVVATSVNRVDLGFLPQGLHDLPHQEMTARVQAAVDAVEADRYDAILLGYGLCNNGLAGLVARQLPLVLPRAHDCITLFLGSRQRYLEYFHSHPGVYFLTTGWLERDVTEGDLQNLTIQHQTGMDRTYLELVEKYGKDNADFLWEQLCQATLNNYGAIAYIQMGVEPDDRFEREAEQQAAARGWPCEKVKGDLSLLRRLVDGPWDEGDFLRVAPGERIVADCAHDRVVRAEPV